MSVFKRLFARKHTDAAPHSHLASGMSQAAGQSKNGTRRELLRMVLRDTLSTHGIPHAWIGADVLANTSSSGVRSIHLRLVIKHWDPRLLTHSVALQQALIERATSFDPFASEWLSGISWRFALADDSACPPMPEAIVWTSQPAPYAAQPVAARGGSADGQAAGRHRLCCVGCRL